MRGLPGLLSHAQVISHCLADLAAATVAHREHVSGGQKLRHCGPFEREQNGGGNKVSFFPPLGQFGGVLGLFWCVWGFGGASLGRE